MVAEDWEAAAAQSAAVDKDTLGVQRVAAREEALGDPAADRTAAAAGDTASGAAAGEEAPGWPAASGRRGARRLSSRGGAVFAMSC